MVCNSILQDQAKSGDATQEADRAQSEADAARDRLAGLLDFIADEDLETIGKILHALRHPEKIHARGPATTYSL